MRSAVWGRRFRSKAVRRLACVLACLMMAGSFGMLSACGEKPSPKGMTVQVYFLSSSETKVELREYAKPTGSAEEQIKTLTAYLSAVSDKFAYKSPLNMGFSVLNYDYNKDGSLILNVDKAYLDLTPTTEVLTRAAIVQTLLQADNVKRIQFLVEGNPLMDAAGDAVGWMTAERFVRNDGSEINSYEQVRVRLYFANQDGDKLIAAYREKFYSTNVSLEKFVVEEILAGPSGIVAGLYRTVDEDTKLLSVMTKDGICYVNFDANFLKVVNNVTLEVAIYSIVNSLTELPNVNQVQILVNGEIPETFEDATYDANMDIVTIL